MGTLVRTETLVHRIGTEGRISVKTISGLIRVQGTDGNEAKLTVSYRIRATDQAAAERALETGRVIVDRGPSWLEVETPERRISTGIAWLFGGARVGADISLEVPWGTKVRIETMSGSIEATSLVGDQKYRTVSGELRLWGLGGLVEASSISGQVTLENGGDVRLRASSVSGGVKVRARSFYGMTINTTSGSIAIAGALDPAGDYRADSISGTVSLMPLSGVTAELRTVSGNVTSELQNRVEGGRGLWRVRVGDGRTTFKINSTSGGLRILAPGRDSGPWQAAPIMGQPPAGSATSTPPAEPPGTTAAGAVPETNAGDQWPRWGPQATATAPSAPAATPGWGPNPTGAGSGVTSGGVTGAGFPGTGFSGTSMPPSTPIPPGTPIAPAPPLVPAPAVPPVSPAERPAAAEDSDRTSIQETWTSEASVAAETARTSEPSPQTPEAAVSSAAISSSELDVLRALERGEIDVNEAADRLARVRKAADA